jgi:hypothetical protein
MRAKPYLRDFFAASVVYDPTSPSGLSWKRYEGRQIKGKGQDGYYRFQLGGSDWKAHRVVWCLAHGDITDGSLHVDHIDRNKENNGLPNLRLVPASENQLNKKKRLARHARKRHNRWESHFSMPVTRKYVYVGTFDTEEQAHLAAVARRLELYWVF